MYPKPFVGITLDTPLTKSNMAKIVYNQFERLVQSAREVSTYDYAELEGAERSNRAALEQMKSDDFGGGWGPSYHQPCSDEYIKQLRVRATNSRKNYEAFKKTLNFVIETFIEEAYKEPIENPSI